LREAPAQTAGNSATAAQRPFGLEISARTAAVGVLIVVMVVAALLAATGAAGFQGKLEGGKFGYEGPLLSSHHLYPAGLRGLLGPLNLGLTRSQEAGTVIAITVAYLGVVALAGSVTKKVAIGVIVLMHLIFLLAPPLLSSDIFNYLGYARLEVVHHLNAYAHGLAYAPHDPTFRFADWQGITTPYGPLFTFVTLPLALIGWIPAIWLMKLAATVASLGCVALVWKCAQRLGRDPVRAALFFGLNPLLLLFGVAGGHNDFMMMLLTLGGIYMLIGERPAGVVGIVAATATKLPAGLLLPFSILGARQRGKTLGWAAAAGLLIAVASVIVFGFHLTSLSSELGNTSDQQTVSNVPGFLLNDVLGLGLAKHTQSMVGKIVLFPVLAALLLRVWRGADWLSMAGWATFAVLATTTWFLPWYIVWWLPIAALLARSSQRIVALGLTALVIALQLPMIY